MHESQLHEENQFITLTYDDENIPWDGSLNKKHFQDFMKRYRKYLGDKRISYFMCGEYGEQLNRPHYHALIFGHEFSDRELWFSREGVNTYVSESLQKLWKFGFSTVGNLNWETAAYCARYALKKRTGKEERDHYWRPLATDLEVELQPEYANMSLKPAIGKRWFDKFRNDCFPSDYITYNGRPMRVPEYYDELLKEEDPALLAELKGKRIRQAWKHNADNTDARLKVKNKVLLAKLKRLTRPLEQ
ncbi:MAG: putative replication initiation protein [Microviridae sp.]|nr:MAG: putative replication initiation protein [Microviridae sp.]